MEEKKNNQNRAIDCDAAIQTAQFRFALIAPLVQERYGILYAYHKGPAYFTRWQVCEVQLENTPEMALSLQKRRV